MVAEPVAEDAEPGAAVEENAVRQSLGQMKGWSEGRDREKIIEDSRRSETEKIIEDSRRLESESREGRRRSEKRRQGQRRSE